MIPKTVDFSRFSPNDSPDQPKRKILGEIQNSPRLLQSPIIARLKQSPLALPLNSPKTPKTFKHSTQRNTRITRVFEERTRFKMSATSSDHMSKTMVKLDFEEETRDCSFAGNFHRSEFSMFSMPKLDFTNAIPKPFQDEENKENYVPEKKIEQEPEFETLHDLEDEFDSHNFDECTKYEIISTDSPNIISTGRATTRKINAKNFEFGAPLADTEASTSFNKPNSATRMLNFDEDYFEFTSPASKRVTSNMSVKKSLKFTETPPKNPLRHEKSDSSIGSMISPCSSRRFPSESTTSMESGFVSEFEEPFLEIEDVSNSPKLPDFNDLLSGQIKENFAERSLKVKKPFQRSLSFNPEASKSRASLFSIKESPLKRSNKRSEDQLNSGDSKRRKANCSPQMKRPVLHRAFSENNASIMSAMSRSDLNPDLIGDFTQPFALPLTMGDHADLKSISCDTLASLLRGEFEDSISDFQVIDCRYPYEYEGGHIAGAVNMYTTSQILSLVNQPGRPRVGDGRRSILVFHCEFSLERGPNMSRFLRSSDRAKNQEVYPNLDYPEVYLLHEGYRAFFKRYPEMCSPNGYTAMLDPEHRHQLRRHRSVQLPSATGQHKRNRLLL
ncbi:M-phase inducer phosphatase-like isoform X2 [Aricia agestis]|nr:M-phase inducer phosphatase-like isoform X2 [Aricia agestis]